MAASDPASVGGPAAPLNLAGITADPTVRADQAALSAARQAAARANNQVAIDVLAHSPSCVATDQKLASKAQLQVAQAETQLQASGGTVSLTI
jgi:hypothetical protein